MSAASERGTSSRSRASSNARQSSSARRTSTARQSSSAGPKQASSTKQSSGAGQRARQSSQARSRSRAQNGSGPSNRSRSSAQRDGHESRGALSRIVVPAATATIGVAGGILLGRNARQRTRKVLGIPLPVNVDFGDLTEQIGQAGRQFGKLAREVQAVREKAEQLGKAVS